MKPVLVATCTLVLAVTSPAISLSSPAAEKGAWTATPTEPLPAGNYSVQARQVDAGGNLGATTVSAFTLDLSVSAVTLATPVNGSLTRERRPLFSGSADQGMVTINVYEGTVPGASPIQSLSGAVDEESGTWSAQGEDDLSDGFYSAVAKQTSPAGTGSSNTVAFTVDGTAPAVTLVTPASGSATSDDTPAFEGFGGTAEGDEPEVTIEVWAGSDTSAEPVLVMRASVDPVTAAWTATPNQPLPAGIYYAQAEQADAAGNSGASGASFAVDTASPIFVGVGAGQIVEQTAPAGAAATYSAPAVDELDPAPTVQCSPPSGAVFPPGVTAVSCRATDWAGNSAEIQLTVTVANTLRPAAVQGLRARTANGRVGLSWRTPVDWDHDRVVVRRALRGRSAWRVVYEGSATAFADRRVVNDTEYVYEAVAYDSAGNISAAVSTGARPSAFLSPTWNAIVKGPRLLRWAAIRKAAYYNVQLWRNGHKILSRWPTSSRFRLQKSWTYKGRRYRLADGTYLAYAWPGFGAKPAARYGRLIGWTKFRVEVTT
jgi:hypothetical protein